MKNNTFKTLTIGLATSFVLAAVAFGGFKKPVQVKAAIEKTRVIVNNTNVYEFDDAVWGWIEAATRANSTDEVKFVLGQDWEHDSQLTLTSNKKLIVDLNGHYIKRTRDKRINDGSVFLVESNAVLTVMDSNPDSAGYDGVHGGVITGGASGNSAGGVHIKENGHVIWQGGTLYNCTTDYHGGGFYLEGNSGATSLEMTGGRVYACQTVESTDKCHGGAIYISNGSVNIHDVTFDNCFSEDYGGAIYADNGYLNVYNSLFTSNYAKDYGGAVYLAGDALIYFKDCIFANNKCDDDGGAIYINNNPSEEKAAQYSNLGSPATIFDGCTFRNNNAADIGGAIFVDDDNVALISVTIQNNTAKTAGGGVWVDSLSDITFKGKCVVKDNICSKDSAFRNVTLQKGLASQAYVYSAGLYAGSYIGINSSSGSNDVVLALKMSKYQMQYFHADSGSLIMTDEHEEDAPMVVTASLFGNGYFWVAVGLGGAGIIAFVVVLLYRKKKLALAKANGNSEELNNENIKEEEDE